MQENIAVGQRMVGMRCLGAWVDGDNTYCRFQNDPMDPCVRAGEKDRRLLRISSEGALEFLPTAGEIVAEEIFNAGGGDFVDGEMGPDDGATF